jgi:hypothetical protein
VHYLNHGLSDFDNLDTSGCNVNVAKGRINVAGNMSGTVGSFGVGSEAGFSATKIEFSQLRGLSIPENASFHSAHSF